MTNCSHARMLSSQQMMMNVQISRLTSPADLTLSKISAEEQGLCWAQLSQQVDPWEETHNAAISAALQALINLVELHGSLPQPTARVTTDGEITINQWSATQHNWGRSERERDLTKCSDTKTFGTSGECFTQTWRTTAERGHLLKQLKSVERFSLLASSHEQHNCPKESAADRPRTEPILPHCSPGSATVATSAVSVLDLFQGISQRKD